MNSRSKKIEVVGTICAHPLKNICGNLKLINVLLFNEIHGYVSVISHEFDDIELGDKVRVQGKWKNKEDFVEMIADKIERL